MAVLNKIRQRSVFLIVIIALALFSFVLADLIRNGGAISQKSQNTIATINGKDIDRTQFAEKVEAANRNFGPNASSLQAVNYVWNQEIRSTVYEEQFEELGIIAGKDQVNDLLAEALASNPTFQNEAGNFDKAKMSEYVANVKETSPQGYKQWVDYEQSIAKSAKEQTYLTLVKAAVGATLKEGQIAYKMENDNVDIQYVQLPYALVTADEVTVTDSEVEAYIKKHPEQYKAEASRDIRYVFFEEKPSAVDEEETMKQVAALLEDKAEFRNNVVDTVRGLKNTSDAKEFVAQYSALPFQDRFIFKKDLPAAVADTIYNLEVGNVYGPYKDADYIKISKVIAQEQMPDSVKTSHILVSWQGLSTAGDTQRTKEEAKKLADSILTVVKTNGDKFDELAAEYSADTSNKDKAGDLGFAIPGMMVPPFNDFIFQNQTGDIDVVETSFGYHVVRIEEQKNEQKAIKVATVAVKVEPSEKTLNETFTETTKFQIAASEGDFAEIAKEKDLQVRPVNNMKSMDENIPGVGSQRSIVQWSFNEETAVGDIKRFEVKGGYAVVQLTSKASEGLMKVEDAAATVRPILIREKKAEILKGKLSGSSLEDVAKSQGQTVKTASALNMKTPTISGAGTEPKVVGTAFALEVGKLSQPIVGKNGVYLIKVLKKTDAPELESYLSFATQTSMEQANSANSRVFNALKEAAEIEDNRARFY
ncbi:peptidylprolyl isomerase [Aquimarina brevivitae]|uniref:Periplasmic chaperone PpiD n=1 Tax=Aquimarina brevivitae TaxID=323412 RepID=A0A4Q7PIY0_9FLAO|nr:peptidylprolyl isomerase [Aquimarina brevivitae]RZS99790.1 peptidylprolyl isomerase/peptidyl-prolyl cis-trans isomerase D [Aquimarina brevivitae]